MGQDQHLTADELATKMATQLVDLRNFVDWIARDYVELSHDKVRWQRDDYMKRAAVLKQKYAINLPPPSDDTPLDNDF